MSFFDTSKWDFAIYLLSGIQVLDLVFCFLDFLGPTSAFYIHPRAVILSMNTSRFFWLMLICAWLFIRM